MQYIVLIWVHLCQIISKFLKHHKIIVIQAICTKFKCDIHDRKLGILFWDTFLIKYFRFPSYMIERHRNRYMFGQYIYQGCSKTGQEIRRVSE